VCIVSSEKELLKEISLSPINLSYFDMLSDSVGMRQHAIHGVPLLTSGYTLDDNARALIAMLDFGALFRKERANTASIKFLSFMNHMQMPNGWFRNLLSLDRRFDDSGGGGDCFGRAVWACGRTLNSWLNQNQKLNAGKMLERALPNVPKLEELRPIALSLIGLCEAAKSGKEDIALLENVDLLADKMVAALEINSDENWQWFEDALTYDNARMPQALFAAFQSSGKKRFLEAAEKSFGFLASKTIEGEMFVPVGQDGWFPKNGKKALFDQQPIEAAAMVQAATAGYFATSNDDYKKSALTSFNWFFGGNSLGAAVYDKRIGACFDGLTPKEVNMNQGAESMVEFLLARFCIERMRRQKI